MDADAAQRIRLQKGGIRQAQDLGWLHGVCRRKSFELRRYTGLNVTLRICALSFWKVRSSTWSFANTACRTEDGMELFGTFRRRILLVEERSQLKG